MTTLKELALRYVYEGILISDPQGNIIFVNDQYCRITGLKYEEIIGRNLQDLLDERLINRAISLDVIQEKKIITTQHNYVSGKEALSTAVPIYDNGTFVGVVNTTRNISELVRLKEEVLDDAEGLTRRFAQEIDLYRNILNRKINFIYTSKAMEQTVQSAKKVAPFDTTVQIYGDSGTGKEVLARFIHQQSKRCDGPFIKVNCAAIPSELFESELFGYVDGAFTGANKKGKLGLFEAANKGTLLLDEVGELPFEMQSKLLRVIQEQEIYRIGSEEPIKIDVRILSATNKNLAEEVRAGKFREDLFFRLNVFPIAIAPLKHRREDIPLLIDYVLEKLNRKYKTTKVISKKSA